MRSVVTLVLLLLPASSWSFQAPKAPLAFAASFDGTLSAQARGSGVPVKVTGPVQYRPGKFGQALLCGEGGATVEYASQGNLRPAAGTVEMWVCPLDWTGTEDEFHVFLEARDPGWLVFYRYYQGGILTLLGTDGDHYRAAAGPPIQWKPGEWHHIAGTWRASRLEVYVDGKRAGVAERPQLPERLGPAFTVGDAPWHIARKRQTLVDEVKIYSVPLDEESIARAARGEPVRFKPHILLNLTADPDAGKLVVDCDAAGAAGPAGGMRARVELLPEGKDEPRQRADIATFRNEVGRCVLDVAGLPQGNYEVRATLLGASGSELARGSAPFRLPGPPVWSGSTLGMRNRVLRPWSPLQVAHDRQSIACWGRRYTFGTLLKSVLSSGADLLSRPVAIEAVVGGRTVALTGQPCRLQRASATRALFAGVAEGAGLRAIVRHEVQYDGYTWTDLDVQPSRPVKVDELRITWRMPRSQATLMHADQLKWIGNPAGALRPEGWSAPFVPFFWLGNEERGLAWFAESERDWRPSPERPAIQVTPVGDAVAVTVRLIAAATVVSSKLSYGFGMMATPVRPQPRDARRWRIVPGVRPTFEIIWPNDNMKWYGYPEPADPRKFAAHVEEAHRKGCLVVPYVNLNYVSAGAPEWQYYGSRWADPARVVTPSDVAAMGHPSMGTCPASRDWQDFILYRINEMIDRYKVDGIYIDCWGPMPCEVGACGWLDDAGKRRGTHPIRAYREILRRVYALFQEKRAKPLLMVHMSSEVVIPELSFTDSILDGEQFAGGSLKDDYLDLLPPDKFRAEFMGRNWGPAAFFLPELREPNVATGTQNLAAYLLLHDVQPWPIWSDGAAWNRLFDALDAYGISGAQFVPYWKSAGAQPAPQVLVSRYTASSGTVLAIMNTGDAIEARIPCDATPLTAATDLLRGDKLKVEGGSIVVPLTRHQGRIVMVADPRHRPGFPRSRVPRLAPAPSQSQMPGSNQERVPHSLSRFAAGRGG